MANIARPDGNFTGVSGATAVVAGKSVQLFHEIKPATKALGLLLNEPDPFRVPLQREVEAAGKAQQIEIVPMMLKGRDESCRPPMKSSVRRRRRRRAGAAQPAAGDGGDAGREEAGWPPCLFFASSRWPAG